MSNIVVPELGESVVEARVARWLKKAGDSVEVGEPLVELETEKVDLEVNADTRGVIASIAHNEGDDVKIGDVLGVIDDSGAAVQPTPPSGNGSKKTASPPSVSPTPEAKAESEPPAASKPEPKAESPAPTREAPVAPVRERTIAPTSERPVAPTTEKPIASTSERPVAPTREAGVAPTATRTEERVRMTKRRATIARRLVEAQHNAAMLTTFNEVDMSAVMSLRERQKEAFKKAHGVGLGIASFFVKASIAALREFPALNAEIQGDEIVYKRYYDIGMAVGAEGGLVVPVLRDADRMTFPHVEKAIRDFAGKAQDGTLTLEDLRGGTFTITNGGVFGSLMSTPILNPPQVAILGLHKIQDRVVPVNGQPVIRPMMYVALSYDHRIVDGREAVQFLVRIKHYVEDPGNLLLEG
jgi:2-oxoglutarate dehydrogenase E2 component (dihydrolipoamide succinyltransferase)